MTRKAALGSILVVGLTPFILLGVVVSVVKAYGFVRYDPAYFTEPYIAEYDTASAVAKALESALQTDDQALLAELQGLRCPGRFDTSPTITWVQLWGRTGRYITYLYFDVSAYKPYPHHLEERWGRWVVSPPDVYYFVESGEYKPVFVTFALTWWISGVVAIVLVYLFSAWERLGGRP